MAETTATQKKPRRKTDDMVGRRFGKLVVLRVVSKGSSHAVVEYCCDCGSIKSGRADSLHSGALISCGCIKKEYFRKKLTTHGQSCTLAYKSWVLAKSRCFNPKNTRYQEYGGRGITMCSRWRESWVAFAADMGPRVAGLSIERMNNDGNYSCGNHALCQECRKNKWPANCKWATCSEQLKNTRRTTWVDVGTGRKRRGVLAKECGISDRTVRSRVSKGWSIEDALLTPKRRHCG